MRLRKFRARAYRCIHDSGEIRVGDLAAFVGRNESGKTTILQALTLLNRDQEVSELDLCDEMTDELNTSINQMRYCIDLLLGSFAGAHVSIDPTLNVYITYRLPLGVTQRSNIKIAIPGLITEDTIV